jgi:methylase of polypeptide subunit release factors
MSTAEVPLAVDLRGAQRAPFGGLTVHWGGTVLVPRPWTLAQSHWADELLQTTPVAGPVVELCAGGGFVGLEAIRRSGRDLVQVERDAEACAWAWMNALVNGLDGRVEVHCADLSDAPELVPRAALVLADPPYVRTDATHHHPEDAVERIDGGADGLVHVGPILDVSRRLLDDGGACLLQLGGEDQADALESLAPPAGMRLVEVRHLGPDRAIALLEAETSA